MKALMHLILIFFLWINDSYSQVPTSTESQVIDLVNLSRTQPEKFLDSLVRPYADKNKISGKYYKSLIRDLSGYKPANPLIYRKDLYLEAKKHAIDMGKTGKASHNSSKGLSYEKRTRELTKTYSVVGENCQYGYEDPLSIVIDLLVDEGISNLGHRKAILNPDYKYIGVSIQPHKKFIWNSVMEFGGELNKDLSDQD